MIAKFFKVDKKHEWAKTPTMTVERELPSGGKVRLFNNCGKTWTIDRCEWVFKPGNVFSHFDVYVV